MIFLTFADIKGQTYQSAREAIISAVAELYQNHAYLLLGEVLSEDEKEYFRLFSHYAANPSADKLIEDASVARALKQLSFYLSRYYGKKVLLFLDEYDTPLHEAYVNGYWEELAGFIRSMFNSASEKYCTQFGFTEEEVFHVLETFEMQSEK